MLFWLHAALLRLLPSLPAMLSDMMASAFLQIAVHQARFMLIGETTLEDFGSIMSVLLSRSNKTGLPKPLDRSEVFIIVGS